ncbi:hypothetical protein, partial [Akkermansia massiliensis]
MASANEYQKARLLAAHAPSCRKGLRRSIQFDGKSPGFSVVSGLTVFGSFFHHTAEGRVPSLIFVRSFYKGRDSFVPRKEFMEKNMGEGHIPRRLKLSRWKSRRHC